MNEYLKRDASNIMQLRTDSKGSPLRRAMVGDKYWYDGFIEKIKDRNKLFQQSTKNFPLAKESTKSFKQTKTIISPVFSPSLSPLLSP